ncbi:MAG: zinc-ribbon domain containing protein [Bacteroidota bacterium]
MKINCPCCKKRIERKKLKQVCSLFPFKGGMVGKNQDPLGFFLTIASKYPDTYQWACDDCIKSERAILANPNKQYYSFTHPMDTGNPYLAYFDKGFTCQTCQKKVVFSKEEQQYWYEDLSFVIYAKPVNCKTCRKEIRTARNLNTELSELLKNGIPKEKEKLLRISEIYKVMGNKEKMKKFLHAANKL